MNNKASIANLLNDYNTSSSSSSSSSPSSSSYEIQNSTTHTSSINNKKNLISSRFTNTEKSSQHHQPLSPTIINTTTLMDYPQQTDTTIINGAQIVTTNEDLSYGFTHPYTPYTPQFLGNNNNWMPPPPALHPLYTYEPPPKMPVYKKSKKKSTAQKKQQPQKTTSGSTSNNDDALVTPSENSNSNIRIKRSYTKKPLDRLKRPRNGYMIYMNEVYEDVKRKNPQLKFGELSSKIGLQWKEMSKAQQLPFHQRHEEEKAAYESAKLAMSRSNLQIVEETIDIEQQVKAAELKAAQAKSKQQNNLPNNHNGKRSLNGEQSMDLRQKQSFGGDIQSTQQQYYGEQSIYTGLPYSYNNQGPYLPPSEAINKFNRSQHENGHFVTPNVNNIPSFYVQPPFGNDAISQQHYERNAVAQQPSIISRKNSRHGIPITPTSPNFTDQTRLLATPTPQENARQRTTFIPPTLEAQRSKFKHFSDLKRFSGQEFDYYRDESMGSITEFNTITAPQSAEQSMDEDDDDDDELPISLSDGLLNRFATDSLSNKAENLTNKENLTDFDDDEEEQIDQLRPSDRSDSEMEGIEQSSSESSKLPTEVTGRDNDTSKIWYLPIEGTAVSSGLTPYRKRKILKVEDSEEEVVVPPNISNCLNNKRKKK